MATNPILDRQPQRAGSITTEMLFGFADILNDQNWVRLSGGEYFVNRRTDEKGRITHYLDRKA